MALPANVHLALETPGVMSENSAIAFREIITALLNEDGLFSLEERRGNARRSFVRPVHVVFGDKPDEVQSGFTRDLSDTGIGLMHKFKVSTDDIATITIGRLWDGPVSMKCRVCWSADGQSGWYQSGWQILSVDACEGS
jgi:PilZ domain